MVKLAGQKADRLEQIMLNPLSYVHLRRLRLPHSLNTPRQRAAVNEILVAGLPRSNGARYESAVVRQLLMYWRLWPAICTLVGAQQLKQELAWRGKFLHFSAPVRFFMSLRLRGNDNAGMNGRGNLQTQMPAYLHGCDLQHQVQGLGLGQLLAWQRATPGALKGRLQLLFPPELDACFEYMGRHLVLPDLFLISQAIQYAKNLADDV